LDQGTFKQLAAEGYNRIPVWRSVLADLDTPLSAYQKLAGGADSYLFESVEGGETWGRYSIIGLPCRRRLEVRRHELSTWLDGDCIDKKNVTDPLVELAAIRAGYKAPKLSQLPAFSGGLVGYFGYETVQYIEPLLANEQKDDQLDTPEIVLLESNEVAVFDNLQGRLFLIVNVDPADSGAWDYAQQRLDELAERLRTVSPSYGEAGADRSLDESDFRFEFSRQDFIKAVQRSKDYILAGDIFQVVLSQRMSVPFSNRPLDVYRSLRALNPSPYMFYLDLGDTQIVGSSPEVLIRVMDGEAVVRPIAGTRPRSTDPVKDQALEKELLADPKERAEHLMLIDLGRNDIGRVCQTGSVELTDKMIIERYSHVMHIVSQVQGRLRPGLSAMDALRAAFPAGTLSGAPKIRAMQIIDELEPLKRNIYAGAVGYLNWHDNADLAIAIRTAVIKDGQLHVQAGAGIVADSDPEREWEETMNKGRALISAVSSASRGL